MFASACTRLYGCTRSGCLYVCGDVCAFMMFCHMLGWLPWFGIVKRVARAYFGACGFAKVSGCLRQAEPNSLHNVCAFLVFTVTVHVHHFVAYNLFACATVAFLVCSDSSKVVFYVEDQKVGFKVLFTVGERS